MTRSGSGQQTCPHAHRGWYCGQHTRALRVRRPVLHQRHGSDHHSTTIGKLWINWPQRVSISGYHVVDIRKRYANCRTILFGVRHHRVKEGAVRRRLRVLSENSLIHSWRLHGIEVSLYNVYLVELGYTRAGLYCLYSWKYYTRRICADTMWAGVVSEFEHHQPRRECGLSYLRIAIHFTNSDQCVRAYFM